MNPAKLVPKRLGSLLVKREIISSEIVQFGPNQLREATKVHAAAALLERYGWLVALPEGSDVRGKACKHAWRIVRGY